MALNCDVNCDGLLREWQLAQCFNPCGQEPVKPRLPPHKKPRPWLPPPFPQPINPPPGSGFFLGGTLLDFECAPCEDGSIPSLESGCDCAIGPGCGCGLIACACLYERCLTAKMKNPVLPGFPGLGGITDCLVQLHACELNPPACPDYHTQVITKISCLKCCDGSTPAAPECSCKPCCTAPSHDAPCAIGECLNLTNGCCDPCGGCKIGECLNLVTGMCEACDSTLPGPPSTGALYGPAALRSSTIAAPPFMLPSPYAGSDFLAATARIGAAIGV